MDACVCSGAAEGPVGTYHYTQSHNSAVRFLLKSYSNELRYHNLGSSSR